MRHLIALLFFLCLPALGTISTDCVNLGVVIANPHFRMLPGGNGVTVNGEAVARTFEARFGVRPTAIFLVGSHVEGAANPSSDVDIFIQLPANISRTHPRLLEDAKFEGPGFQFFRDLNPGRIPASATGLGIGEGRLMLGTDALPKAGILDPFFGTSPDQIISPNPVRLWP